MLRRLQRGGAVRAPAPQASAAPTWPRQRVIEWGPGDAELRMKRADEVAGGTFSFLNHAERLDTFDWNRRHVSHLWSYNLHYFDYAVDLAWAARLDGDRRFADRLAVLATSWIDGTQADRGDGWDPYVISARAVNWIYALALAEDRLPADVVSRIRSSVARQLSHLEHRLEHHLRANHLQRNYRALLVGGLALGGARAARWASIGETGLWNELREQTLADGGHFERSPMYHALALSDYLEAFDLCRTAGRPVPEWVAPRLEAMVRAFGILCRPDGDLHLFNDAANGIAPARSYIARLASLALGASVRDPAGALELKDTGYFGFADPTRGERVMVDCGEPGPTYQPGHAHCDMLSFEWDLDGKRIVVDSGTSGYEGDPLREYQRSTRAHNTVMIDGREQSEIWGTFRLARRAKPRAAEASLSGEHWRFRGSCEPYHSSRMRHERTIERPAFGRLRIIDHVTGAPRRRIQSFLHLHPDYDVLIVGMHVVAAAPGYPTMHIEFSGFDAVQAIRGMEQPAMGWFSPEFGVRKPAIVLESKIERYDGRSFGYTFAIRGDEAVS